MSKDNVTDLPDRSVVIDLDAEERDQKDIKPPFITKIGGRKITFADPEELDWRDLAAVAQPGDLLHVSLSSEDLDHVRKQELPTWKFSKLMEAYYEHYDLESKIKNARRQAALNGGF